jgi:Uma2 family endonuclease
MVCVDTTVYEDAMEISLQRPCLAPEQYLALERNADHRSEYVNGHIFAMAGAGKRHNQITFNIAVSLGTQLKGRKCIAYASDMRIKISQTSLYTYPDIVATCHEPLFEDTELDTLLNPSLIVEVLSNSTEAYDRGAKFAHYRRLPSLQEYLLIAQNHVCVEQFIRKDDQWTLTETDHRETAIQLDSINCILYLSDIYDKVQFTDDEMTRRIFR